MENITKRRIVAILGMIIALGGLTGLIWGLLYRDSAVQLIGFVSILIAYVFTVIVKKMKEKELADQKALKLE